MVNLSEWFWLCGILPPPGTSLPSRCSTRCRSSSWSSPIRRYTSRPVVLNMSFCVLLHQPNSGILFQVVNVTGNQDICFYNFLCAHPLGALRWVVFQVSAQLRLGLRVFLWLMLNFLLTAHSTTSSVTLVTWCWDFSSFLSSSRETSSTIALSSEMTSMHWYGMNEREEHLVLGSVLTSSFHLLQIRFMSWMAVLVFPLGMRDSKALWSFLRHGDCSDDGGLAECLLPRLSQLHQLPVWWGHLWTTTFLPKLLLWCQKFFQRRV